MAFMVRRLVSTNKRRYQTHGYDLDLSYITPQIIAMGFPCDGLSGLYRNPVNDVVRLLEERHAGRYKVYNLCVERGYHSRTFQGRLMRVPMYDGQAPPLHMLVDVCRDAMAWLAADPAHVVAVHCKAGKGRTGVVVCALLMAMDPGLHPSSLEQTLALWATRRTKDGKGLTIPSQRRYVGYFHQVLLAARGSGNGMVRRDVVVGGATHAVRVDLVNGASRVGTCADGRAAVSGRGIDENSATGGLDGAGREAAGGAAGCVSADACGGARTDVDGAEGGLQPGNVPGCVAALSPSPAQPRLPNPSPGSNAARTDGPQGPPDVQPQEVPTLMAHVRIPQHGVKILRLRFRGLPDWLLRDCTASVWWRPVGHYEAHPVCHVRTRAPRGCTGAAADEAEPVEADSGGPSWSIGPRQNKAGGAMGPAELCLDLTTLPPLPPPPPPSPLPYFTPSYPPAPRPATGSGSRDPGLLPGQEPDAVASWDGPPAGAKPGPPLVSGDIKIQLFLGALHNPPHDVFKGKVTQFSAWICTSYLDLNATSLELGRGDLDKISKRLRRWPGPLGVELEYAPPHGPP